MRTNHWGDSRGSTIVPLRWHSPMLRVCGFSETSSPRASRSVITRFRASNRSSPAYGPAASLVRAASSRTEIIGRLCRSPVW